MRSMHCWQCRRLSVARWVSSVLPAYLTLHCSQCRRLSVARWVSPVSPAYLTLHCWQCRRLSLARWVSSVSPAYLNLPYIVHSAGDYPWQGESRQSHLPTLTYLTLFTVQEIICGKVSLVSLTCLPYLTLHCSQCRRLSVARWVSSVSPAYLTLPYIVHSAGDYLWQGESRQSHLQCL